MADKKTIEVPDPVKVVKEGWRRFRAIVWTLWVALAVTLVVVTGGEPHPAMVAFRWWIIFIGAAIYFWPQMANRFGVKRG